MQILQRTIDHGYIFSSLFLGIYSQLVMRWQVGKAGTPPEMVIGKAYFVAHLFMNPWVLSGLAATFMSGVMWMLAMTKFEISYAYPWMSLNFVLVTLFGILFLGEVFTVSKIIGSLLICLGITILAK